MDELKENLKTLLRKAITNAKDGDEKGEWITINGTHVFIPEGKTAEDVIKEKGWKDKGEGKEKAEDEPVKLDVADKPTKEAQEAIDRERQRTQRIAEEHKKEYEKSKNIDLTKLKLDNPQDKGTKYFSKFSDIQNLVGTIKMGEEYFESKVRTAEKHLKDKLKVWEKDYEKETKPAVKQIKKRNIEVVKDELEQLNKLKSITNDKEQDVKNGLSEIIKNCKPKTKEDLKILKGLKDILEEQ